MIERILKPFGLCILVLAVVGCATVSSDELIPKSFTLPAGSEPFPGTVQVNVSFELESLRIVRPRELVNLDILATHLNVSRDVLWKAIAADNIEIGSFYADIRLNMYMIRFSNLKIPTGAFGRTRTAADTTTSGPYAMTGEQALTYGASIKDALEKSIVNRNLFSGIRTMHADYVLDVWVDRIAYRRPVLGMGEYSADVYAIWRLIRSRDRKVMACDFVSGHGVFAQTGFGPTQQSYHAAVRDLIDKGFLMLFDHSGKHLNALFPAGMNRLGMRSVRPEDAEQWDDNIRRNWSKLHKDMTVDEVEAAIGPFRINHDAWDYHYILPVRFNPSLNYPMQGLGEMAFVEYKTNLYKLVFVSFKGHEHQGLSRAPKLLFWRLK